MLCENAELLVIDSSSGTIASRSKTLPLGHAGFPVNNGSVLFSADGETIITYGYDCEVWDVATGTRRFEPIHHGGRGYAVAISPDGKTLATAGFDNKARTWDLTTGEPRGPTLDHPAWLMTICFSPDGRTLVTGGEDAMVRLWDWSRGTLTCVPLVHRSMISTVAFMPDGESLFTLDSENRWCLWDPNTGRPLTPSILQRQRSAARQVAMRPDGQRLVLSGMPLILVDLTTVPKPIASAEEAVRRAELNSGRTMRTGTVINLTSDEWMERWQRVTTRPPLPSLPDQVSKR